MEKKLYLATVIAVIAAIGLILSCGLSYFSDTEEVTYNTFTAGVSDSCTGATYCGWNLWYIEEVCTGDCSCDIYDHISQSEVADCRQSCRVDCCICPPWCCNSCYKDCLATCLDEHTDEMASCERIGNKIYCTCYCPWGGEP